MHRLEVAKIKTTTMQGNLTVVAFETGNSMWTICAIQDINPLRNPVQHQNSGVGHEEATRGMPMFCDWFTKPLPSRAISLYMRMQILNPSKDELTIKGGKPPPLTMKTTLVRVQLRHPSQLSGSFQVDTYTTDIQMVSNAAKGCTDNHDHSLSV